MGFPLFSVSETLPSNPLRITTGTVELSKQVLASDVDETHAVAAADFDGDGDMDAVATDFVDGVVFWYENDGSLTFAPHILDDSLAGAYPISVSDLDQDDDMDVLAAGYLEDVVVWYENDGLGGFTRHDIDTLSDGPHSVVAGDMDLDGDLDLLASIQDGGQVIWYENDGSMGFAGHVIDPAATGAKRAEFCDMDDDGDVDVLVASFFLNEVSWLENDGEQVFVKRVITTDAQGSYFALPADLDGDGDVDVLGASQLDDKIAWYENLGGGAFTAWDIDTNAVGARMVQSADLDGDGDLDVLASSADDSTVSWYENGGGGNFMQHLVDGDAAGAYGVWAADMDRDGAVDILSSARDANTVSLYRHTRNHTGSTDGPSGSLVIGKDLLRTTAGGSGEGAVVYSLSSDPAAGTIMKGGLPVVSPGGFTQADLNADLVTYVHDETLATADAFSFTVSEAGSLLPPAEGTFRIHIGDRLLAHWPLDESVGLIACDQTGVFDGELVSGPVWHPSNGIVSGALSFDGSGDLVDVGVIDVTGGEGLTLSMFINPGGDTGDLRLISKAVGVGEQDHFWMISTYDGTRLRFRLRADEVTSTLITTRSVLEVGKWYHVTCTFDGREMRIYGNGILVACMPKEGVVSTDPVAQAAIGNQPAGAGDQSFVGLIDEVMVFNRALGPQEIKRLTTLGEVSAVSPGSGEADWNEAFPGGRLIGNAPNPFNPLTTIRFEVHRPGPVRLEIYDLRGRRIRSLAAGNHEQGSYSADWDGRDGQGRTMPSGTYLCRMSQTGSSQVRPLLLVR